MLLELLRQFNVATTALLANYWKNQAKSKENWAELSISPGSREKDLFKDPYLNLFQHEAVKMEAEQRLDKRMWLPLATRTRYFRKIISNAVKTQGIEQILILGAGFDTLSFRKKKYSEDFGVRFFEIDRASVMDCKQAILEANGIEKNAVYVGLDYTQENYIEKLEQSAFDCSKPTLILWEGNTFYLEKEQVITVLEQIASRFPHLLLSFDFMQYEIQKETTTLEAFAARQSAFKSFFSVEEIIEICGRLKMSYLSHNSTAELAKIYKVDETPYHTAEPYTVMTVRKGI
jgi:methyltransferase (TIGR00027 family)